MAKTTKYSTRLTKFHAVAVTMLLAAFFNCATIWLMSMTLVLHQNKSTRSSILSKVSYFLFSSDGEYNVDKVI